MEDSPKATILYVDDLEQLRLDFKEFFEKQGYRVQLASSGEEAVGFMEGNASFFDAVVSDLTLGGMSGFDLLTRVRQSHPELPFIVVSGHTSPLARARASSLRSSAFFEKPYRFKELEDKLSKLLGQN